MPLPARCRGPVAVTLLCAVVSAGAAAPPTDAAARAAVVGAPVELTVTPASVVLTGPRDVRQLVVTGRYTDGTVRDLTGVAEVRSGLSHTPPYRLEPGLFVRPTRDGAADVVVEAGGKEVRVPVTVRDYAAPARVSFRRDVVAALNVGGCNMGACHGTPSGKNGFKLSLRGSDPAADFVQLTRDQFGRRADTQNPDAALVLLKGLGKLAHEGGGRFGGDSVPAEMIRTWLRQGTPDDPADLPAVAKLDVLTGPRVQRTPARWQQLAVVATFADGAMRDVTRLTNFSSSDTAVADVSAAGGVEFKRPGEVAILARYLECLVPVRLTYLEPRADFAWPDPPANNFVDTHVFAKLKQMTIPPSDLCTDAEFVRRAYGDAAGRLPTPAEARAFVADPAAGKRAALIDRLLTLPEFADFWALKWADVLRSNRKTMQAKGSYGLQLWLRGRIASNAPVDGVVRDLLTAGGNTYSNPPANYYRTAKDPQALAEATAQLFLGVRMGCAKCHNHPFERWSQDDYYGFAAWFARVKTVPDPATPEATPKAARAALAEVVVSRRDGEVVQPRTQKVMAPRYLGVGDAAVPPGADRRAALADWLLHPTNPFFARSFVNRVWFHLMGRGIVDPVDDFRESNPASNDELLDALASDFAGHGFDLRRLVGTVMKSWTYQLSATPTAANADDARYFSHAVTKLLTAEQLLDAVCDVTGVPEKFAGLPAGTRAVQLPDGEVNHPFLKAFGQPARELVCECERESDGNLAQALQLVNGPTVNEKVRNPANRLTAWRAAGRPDRDVLADVYLAALSRPPTADEAAAALGHVAAAADKRRAWEDVLWAVLNTREFLFRH